MRLSEKMEAVLSSLQLYGKKLGKQIVFRYVSESGINEQINIEKNEREISKMTSSFSLGYRAISFP